MAKAKAKCICATCGKEFVVEKNCFNRADANNFESYAAEHYDECKDCYLSRIKAAAEKRANALIEKYNLPLVTGVSEKQIAYADNLRRDFLNSCTEKKFEFAATADSLLADRQETLRALADEHCGGNIEEAKIRSLEAYGLLKYYTLLHESNAGKIIELLKD